MIYVKLAHDGFHLSAKHFPDIGTAEILELKNAVPGSARDWFLLEATQISAIWGFVPNPDLELPAGLLRSLGIGGAFSVERFHKPRRAFYEPANPYRVLCSQRGDPIDIMRHCYLSPTAVTYAKHVNAE